MSPTLFRARKFDSKSLQDSFYGDAFNEFWPEYKSWYQSKKSDAPNPDVLKEAEAQLIKVMPELIPIYESFRELSNDCPIASNFLTGYQPPAYLVNCSQAVLTQEQPILIRNYDLSPSLSENLITHSNFLGQSIIGTNECLWGLDDGMNSAGLAASLTFGGSKKVGKGFGIPFIMRYVLETCETVKQAIKVLQ
ncbi:MAG: putative choloylglycine hydrolase [Cocleimonas sp.]|jgi:predicted choloylglycine hydrolase